MLFENETYVSSYTRWLDLETGIAGMQYTSNEVTYKHEVLTSSPDQVIMVRITADKPGSISFKVQLRGDGTLPIQIMQPIILKWMA